MNMEKKNKTEEKIVKLYIACFPKSALQEQKNCIASSCNKLEEGKKIHIKIVDYDDPEKEGVVPRNFIKENADIVVFLLDEKYDEKILDRFVNRLNVAIENYSDTNRPVILVYLTDEAEKRLNSSDSTKEKELLSLLKESKNITKFDNRTSDKSNELDSFKKFIEHNIENYIKNYKLIIEARRIVKRNRRWAIYGVPMIFIIIIIIVVLIFMWQISVSNQKRLIESQPRLLLVGGGSAKNYIRDECGIDVISNNPKFWIYAPMPSSNSWTLLTEEAMKDDAHRKYYPICLSAAEADDTVFLGNMEPTDFKKKGVVVSLLIGYDTLKAYCNSSYINRKFLDDMLKQSCRKHKLKDQDSIIITYFDSIFRTKTIGCMTLNAIIQKDKSIKLYTTSLRSGTRNAYIDPTKANLQFLTKEYDPNNHKIELYTDNSTIDSSLNFIVLGSKHYKPYHGISNAKALTVLDKNGNQIIKPIYLYFMAYNTNEKYEIKEEISNFLDKIGKSLSEDQINKIKKSKSFIVKINLSDDKK